MVAILLVALWMLCGALACGWYAGRKGYDEGDWMLLGAALGPFAFLTLRALPTITLVSYLVHDRTTRRLVTCPSCGRAVSPRDDCSACQEPLPRIP